MEGELRKGRKMKEKEARGEDGGEKVRGKEVGGKEGEEKEV